MDFTSGSRKRQKIKDWESSNISSYGLAPKEYRTEISHVNSRDSEASEMGKIKTEIYYPASDTSSNFQLEDYDIRKRIYHPKKASLQLRDDPAPDQLKDTKKDVASKLFAMDCTYLELKPDHESRSIWVCNDGRIFLEAFSPFSSQVQDYLITVAEPISRTTRIHEFRLTPYSLYAAVSAGMETETILEVMDRFSKITISQKIIDFIRECTASFGKIKLVLKDNRYYMESNYPQVLKLVLNDLKLHDAIVNKESIKYLESAYSPIPLLMGESKLHVDVNGSEPNDEKAVVTSKASNNIKSSSSNKADGNLLEESTTTYSFEIKKPLVETVKKICIDLDYPFMEEYDFLHDKVNPDLEIELSPEANIRDYQEKCLCKIFCGGAGRARSGTIVLPTGAGKTLIGIISACTIKKSTLVLCINALSVEQWAKEFKNWTTIKDSKIAKFTTNDKKKFTGSSGVVISTYTMISHTGKRSCKTVKMIEWINKIDWGLLILDEVHVVPANVFRRVLTTVAAHIKIGLTATLVREDDKITDLNFLIGPKLYETSWMDLAEQGHIAKVEPTEVWCDMTAEFYREYLAAKPEKRRLFSVMNPNKFQACEYIIKEREAAGDRIMVFSDNVFALGHYARKLSRPFIFGSTNHEERSDWIEKFRRGDKRCSTIFLSKVGDSSLDLPEATCLIQISSQFGSRRQEAQRMGRILRAKRRNESGFRSRFYTLVSQHTEEVQFSAKRKGFLVNQGFTFKIIPSLDELIPESERKNLSYYTKEDQLQLLEIVKAADDGTANEEIINFGDDNLYGVAENRHISPKQGFPPGKNATMENSNTRKRFREDVPKPREKSRSTLMKILKY